MRLRSISLTLTILLLTMLSASAADIPVNDTPLEYAVLPYEVNRDATGKLYITDWGGGLIWRVEDPASGIYARFGIGGAPNDARPDGAGNIWFTGYSSRRLGRVNAGAGASVTRWDIDPGRSDYNLAGLAFDDMGRVWFTEWGGPEVNPVPLLYRFDPGAGKELCVYTLPNSGNSSYYVLYAGGAVWMSDTIQGRIVRFNPDPASLQATYWSVTAGGEPRGLALEGSDRVWWADQVSSELGRLEFAGANPNRITTYGLPRVSTSPQMVAVREGKIWYSAYGKNAGNIGILDPDLARSTISHPSPVSAAATVTCSSLGEGTTANIIRDPGTLTWGANVWADITPGGSNGWTVYEAADGGYPYGILADSAHLWVTDQNSLQPQLVRITLGGLIGPKVTISMPTGTTAVQLAWDTVTGASQYRTWYDSTDPYFTPGETPATDPDPADLVFTHTGVANSLTNYYYVVRAVAPDGITESANSNRTAKFTFELTKGGS